MPAFFSSLEASRTPFVFGILASSAVQVRAQCGAGSVTVLRSGFGCGLPKTAVASVSFEEVVSATPKIDVFSMILRTEGLPALCRIKL